MIARLFSALFFSELVAAILAIYRFGFGHYLLYQISTAVLGVAIMTIQGRSTLTSLQKEVGQGQMPARRLIHRSLVMFGGFLIFLPGLFTDFIGIIFVLPGIRHALILTIESWIKLLIARGVFRTFNPQSFSGQSGSTFFWTNMGGFQNRQNYARDTEREVYDVTPNQVTDISSDVSSDVSSDRPGDSGTDRARQIEEDVRKGK